MYTRVVAFSRYGKQSPTFVKDAESKCPKLGCIFWVWLYLFWLSPFKNIMLLFLLFARYSIHWFGVHLQHDNLSRWRRHDSNVRTRRDLIYSQALLTAQPLLRLNYIVIHSNAVELHHNYYCYYWWKLKLRTESNCLQGICNSLHYHYAT